MRRRGTRPALAAVFLAALMTAPMALALAALVILPAVVYALAVRAAVGMLRSVRPAGETQGR